MAFCVLNSFGTMLTNLTLLDGSDAQHRTSASTSEMNRNRPSQFIASGLTLCPLDDRDEGGFDRSGSDTDWVVLAT